MCQCPSRCLLVFALIGLASCSRHHSPANPIAVFPAELDLGTRELGEIAVAPFTVANRGGTELILDGLTSNCSCSGIEQQLDGEFVHPEVIRIKPGEQANLRMRVSVRGVPVGARSATRTTFRTNDPARPTGHIEVVISRVTGGVHTSPPSLVVGHVTVGSVVKRILEVRDDAVAPRSLDRVTSSQPERVTVRRIEADAKTPADPAAVGTRIAILEVTVDTRTPGDLGGTLTLHLADSERKPDVVRVIGRVVPPIEISPPTVVLPRSSPEGLVYAANCLLRSADGKPLSVVVEDCPSHLAVTAPGPHAQPSAAVTLTVSVNEAALRQGAVGGDYTVKLRCRVGDQESVEELRVLLPPPLRSP